MLGRLKENFEKLIALYETEKESNARLLEELSQVKSDNEACRKQISELNKQIDNLKLAGAFVSSAQGNREAKERIGKLVSEIDKCISMLDKE